MNKFFAEHITNEHILNLPLLQFSGKIHVIESKTDIRDAISFLKHQSVLGFDTETKPTFSKGEYNPTALIQLSTREEAFLFRLNKIGYPNGLFDLLQNDTVQKFGISITDDLKDLKKLRSFEPAGFTDINSIVKDLGVKHIGVKKLSAIFLESRIAKNQQTSNWENESLTDAQKRYAATDAWICLEIHDKIERSGYLY